MTLDSVVFLFVCTSAVHEVSNIHDVSTVRAQGREGTVELLYSYPLAFTVLERSAQLETKS